MQINIKYDDRHYEHIGHEEQQKDEKVDMNDLFSAKAYKKFLHHIQRPPPKMQKHGLKPRMDLTPCVKMFTFLILPFVCLFALNKTQGCPISKVKTIQK